MLFSTFFLGLAALAQAELAFKGIDWSSLLVEENAGIKYKDTDGSVKLLETILKNNGVNTVRQRFWVNPKDGNYNLDYNIKLAKRATDAGLNIYADFHYSDDWADPGHQTTPSAWKNYDIDDLSWKVYNYTKNCMDAFQQNNIPVALASIGNEITAGLLWPLGKQSDKKGGFANIARLLHSASAGIKDSTILPKPQIMIHLDNGWKWDTQKWWYDGVLAAGTLSASDYDIQGVSYYPFYNSAATLASLESSLKQMKSKYNKQVMVVETNWPISCPNPKYAMPSDAKNIPFSAAGQTTWIQEVAKRVTSAGGNGLFYWEPMWVDNANLGSSCANNLMVDNSGKALSSLSAFKSI